MAIFQNIQDVEEWLAPLDYVSFWDAVSAHALSLQDRDHCDRLIAGGDVAQNVVLDVLKYQAVQELTARYGLRHRIYEPVNYQYLGSTH